MQYTQNIYSLSLISESVDKDSATEIRQFIDDIGGFPVLEASWIDSTFDLEESVARARRYITNNVWPIPSGTLIGLNILNDYKVYGKHVLYVSTTVVPTKSYSDVIHCLQLLSKTLICTLHLSYCRWNTTMDKQIHERKLNDCQQLITKSHGRS